MSHSYVGDALRAARKARHMTLEEVSKETKCSITYLSDVERGRRTNLTDEVLERFERLFDISLKQKNLLDRGVIDVNITNAQCPQEAVQTCLVLSEHAATLTKEQWAAIHDVIVPKKGKGKP